MEVVLWGPMWSTTPVCPLILYGLKMYENNRKEFITLIIMFLRIDLKYMYICIPRQLC